MKPLPIMIALQNAALTFPLLFLAACSFGARLSTETALPADVQGTYTLYLHGCRYPADLENVVLLVDRSSPLRFELFARETAYRVRDGLPGDQALAEASRFIACSRFDIGMSALSRIIGPDGRTLGFELRPLYSPMEFGSYDVQLNSYVLRGDRVTVYIGLDPNIERRQHFFLTPGSSTP